MDSGIANALIGAAGTIIAAFNLTPFAPPDETDFVIDSVRSDITLLPADVIPSVVQYYRVAKQSNLLTRDLRDPVFAAQKEEEKDRFKVGLFQVLEYQKVAIADLAEFAKGQGIDLRPKEVRAAALVNRVRDNFESITKQSG